MVIYKSITYMKGNVNCVKLTLVDFQLDAQNSYLFIYNTFIKILYMFQALPCSSSGGLDIDLLKICREMLETCR